MSHWKHTLIGVIVGAVIALVIAQWQQTESEKHLNTSLLITILFEEQNDKIVAFQILDAGSVEKAEAHFQTYIYSDDNLKDHNTCMKLSYLITRLYDENRNVFEMGRACALVNDTNKGKIRY